MRDRTAIEREILNAREDLEENLDRLVHKAREQLAVRARASHAVEEVAREHPGSVAFTAACVIVCVVVLLFLRRARRTRS